MQNVKEYLFNDTQIITFDSNSYSHFYSIEKYCNCCAKICENVSKCVVRNKEKNKETG